MIIGKKHVIGVAAVLVATVGIAGPLYALSCLMPAEVDVWELELLEVTVDGETVEDLHEYDSFDFQLESQPRGVRFTGVDVNVDSDSDDRYWIDLEPGSLSEKFDEYSQGQGGEQ